MQGVDLIVTQLNMTFFGSNQLNVTFYDLVGMEKTTKYDFIWLDKLWHLGKNLYLRQQKVMLSAICIYLL